MARTFAAALVLDVKHQRSTVLDAIAALLTQAGEAMDAGNAAKAQGCCATAFTLWPAVISADAFLTNAIKVDFDDPLATQKLISPLVMTALNYAAQCTAPKESGAIGMLAAQYQTESFAEVARSCAALKDQFDQRVGKGEMVEHVLAELFAVPQEPQQQAAIQ